LTDLLVEFVLLGVGLLGSCSRPLPKMSGKPASAYFFQPPT
jgi:hypothetical protein